MLYYNKGEYFGRIYFLAYLIFNRFLLDYNKKISLYVKILIFCLRNS